MPKFNSEQAKILQKNAVLSRKSSVKNAHIKLSQSAILRANQYASDANELTQLTLAMLRRTALKYDKSSHGAVFDMISKSFERLFGVWAHLTCTPAPGAWRPQSRASQAEAEKRLARILKSQPMIDVEVGTDEDAAKMDAMIDEIEKQVSQPIVDEEEKESTLSPEQPSGQEGKGGGGTARY